MAAERRTFEDREERDAEHWRLVDLGFKPIRYAYLDPKCLEDDSLPAKTIWGLTWGEEVDL